jgi:hypothetical protein
MGRLQSLDIETHNNGKQRNPYGPGPNRSSSPLTANNTRLCYFMLCIALFAMFGVGKMLMPADESNVTWAPIGDAAGGWGSEHNHAIVHHEQPTQQTSSGTSYVPPPSPPAIYSEPPKANHQQSQNIDREIRESDFIMALAPIVVIPSHSQPEYEQYQIDGGINVETEDLLYDKNTPHGMAFDFILNRDKRNINSEDPLLIQRFVLTLLFYATGGHDENDPTQSNKPTGRGGWYSEMAHFLTGLHECHWVKKSLEDQFWSILSMEGNADRRMGVTKCNGDMEVTEIRLGE